MPYLIARGFSGSAGASPYRITRGFSGSAGASPYLIARPTGSLDLPERTRVLAP